MEIEGLEAAEIAAKLEPFDLALPYWILVATPPVYVSTAWAYTNFTPPGVRDRQNLRSLLGENIRNPGLLLERLQNEFEPLVFSAYPDVGRLKNVLLDGGAEFALMSGSGSSVFGFVPNESVAKNLATTLSKDYRTSLTEPHFKPERH